jgi:hypothetical protein
MKPFQPAFWLRSTSSVERLQFWHGSQRTSFSLSARVPHRRLRPSLACFDVPQCEHQCVFFCSWKPAMAAATISVLSSVGMPVNRIEFVSQIIVLPDDTGRYRSNAI